MLKSLLFCVSTCLAFNFPLERSIIVYLCIILNYNLKGISYYSTIVDNLRCNLVVLSYIVVLLCILTNNKFSHIKKPKRIFSWRKKHSNDQDQEEFSFIYLGMRESMVLREPCVVLRTFDRFYTIFDLTSLFTIELIIRIFLRLDIGPHLRPLIYSPRPHFWPL